MRRTPKLGQVGRAYSEMSPLNPTTASANTSSSTSQGQRDSGSGYGSLFPFSFLRNSFSKPGSSLQVYIFFIIYLNQFFNKTSCDW